MYSMVLMMAMTGPAEAPAWGAGCAGCTGMWGIFRFGCGAPNFAAHGGGSCLGASNANYWQGSGYGPLTYYGFAGCYGSCYGSYTNFFSYWSTPINSHYGYGMPARATPPAVPPPARPPVAPPPAKPVPKKVLAPAPATVIVSLPADATLFANGVRTSQTSSERQFVTPALNPDDTYHYELAVEAIRDGEKVKETKIVEVYAGATVRVSFDSLVASPKADGSRLASDGK